MSWPKTIGYAIILGIIANHCAMNRWETGLMILATMLIKVKI